MGTIALTVFLASWGFTSSLQHWVDFVVVSIVVGPTLLLGCANQDFAGTLVEFAGDGGEVFRTDVRGRSVSWKVLAQKAIGVVVWATPPW